MSLYSNSRVRAGFAAVAVALAAVVIALTIVVPASMRVENLDSGITHLSAPLPGSIEADIVPARIDVYGVREPKLLTSQHHPIHEADCVDTEQAS